MAAVRRAGRWAHVVLTALFLVGVVVQFLLAGFGIFGETDSLDLHEDLGFTAVHLLSLLVFVAALVGWMGRTEILLGFLIFALTTLQVFLPSVDSGWIAGLHPLNALVLFVLGHVALRRSRRLVRMRELPARGETAASAP